MACGLRDDGADRGSGGCRGFAGRIEVDKLVVVPGGALWAGPASAVLGAGGFRTVAVEGTGAAMEAVLAGDVIGVVIDATAQELGELCSRLRAGGRTENLPIIVVVRDPMRDDLESLFRLGIDDYVPADAMHGLRDRAVVAAAGDAWSGMRAPSGRLVLADPQRDRRILIGRILRRWGFDLSFAADESELGAQIRKGTPPRAVLVDGALPPDGARVALERLRRDRVGSSVPWLIIAPGRELADLRRALASLAPVFVYDRNGPPENVIFALNDLLRPRGAESRRTPRLLYGAPAAFWTEGRTEQVWTYCYNVNRDGLYLRTLVPPPVGTVLHLWFRPPFGEGFAAMDAQVMWRREVGGQAGSLYPSGMGLQFSRRPAADDAGFLEGYRLLLEEAERWGTAQPR